jgi:hypothetical protein
VKLGDFAGTLMTPPIFTTDKKTVLYYKNLQNRSGYVGEAVLANIETGTTFTVATNAVVPLVASVPTIMPDPPSSPFVVASPCGNEFALPTKLLDLLSTADYNGVGELTSVNMISCNSSGKPVTTRQLSTSMQTSDLTLLKGGATFAFTAGYTHQSNASGLAYLSTFSGSPLQVGSNVVPTSLRASPYATRVAFMVSGSIGDYTKPGVGTMNVTGPTGTITNLGSNINCWVYYNGIPFMPDGRALIVQSASSGSRGAGVWIVPVP